MTRALIQPSIDTFDEYSKFAKDNDLGFEIVDFAFPDVLSERYENVLKKYEEKQDKSKLLSAHGAFFDLYINSPDFAVKDVARKRIIQNLETAQKLGLKFVVFHTNCLPMMGREAYYDNLVKEHVVFWKEMVEKFDVTILLENMWDKTPKYIARVIERVDSPKIGVCLDTGHHNVFSEAPLEEWFSHLGKYTPYLHLTDNKGDYDAELVLGEGTIDWKKFSELVKQYCNSPYVVIEVADLQMIETSMKFLKRNKIYPFAGSTV